MEDTVLLFEPKPISQIQLPTFVDTYIHYLSVIEEGNNSINSTVDSILKIWKSKSLPCYDNVSVRLKLVRYFKIVKTLKKSLNKSYFSDSYIKHLRKYDVLLDICTCHCDPEIANCRCTEEKKIPVEEKEFILDQRSTRKIFIEPNKKVDTPIEGKVVKPPISMLMFKVMTHAEFEELQSNSDISSPDADDSDGYPSTYPSDSSDSDTYSGPTEDYYPRFVRACARYALDDDGLATVTSALLKDVKVTNEDGTPVIVKATRIKRQRFRDKTALREYRREYTLFEHR